MESKYSIKLKKIVERLNFEIIHKSSDYDEKLITTPKINRAGLQLAGFFEHFTQERIQLIGKVEDSYMSQFESEEKYRRFADLMVTNVPAVIFCHDMEPAEECLRAAYEFDVTLLKSNMDTSETVSILIEYLNRVFAPRLTRHGVLVEVYGEGVLILGDSGVGKSEAAIELLKRGHRLIADDAVEIRRINSRRLTGKAPKQIRYYMELRGIGVIDIRQIFGSGATKESQQIDVVVNLQRWDGSQEFDRLGVETKMCKILDVEVPEITIPVSEGRNLAIILEVAAMNNRLKRLGHNSALEFTAQLDEFFASPQTEDEDF